MIDPESCRAARGLLNWTQADLATAAAVGVSTVKKFELRKTAPTENNLRAIRRAFESAGVDFFADESGALLRRLRIGPYIPGEGLYFEVKYVDLDLVGDDNDFVLPFKITSSALSSLVGRLIADEADAKAIARASEAKLLRQARRHIEQNGLASPGGAPREISCTDLG